MAVIGVFGKVTVSLDDGVCSATSVVPSSRNNCVRALAEVDTCEVFTIPRVVSYGTEKRIPAFILAHAIFAPIVFAYTIGWIVVHPYLKFQLYTHTAPEGTTPVRRYFNQATD